MTWQDPYGQSGWQDPYGQPGYMYGPPGVPPGRASNGAAIGALIANIVAALFCCIGVGWLPGIILSSIAISRTQTDPVSARNLILWAWICFAITIALYIVFFMIILFTGTFHFTRSV